MSGCPLLLLRRILPALLLLSALPASGRAADIPPPGFKVAFFGDQGLGPASEALLRLIKEEGADLLVHLGDFDYFSDPAAWDAQTDRILGADFPMVAVVGNHDLPAWAGPVGYAERIRARLHKMGVEVDGEAGVQCSFRYQGLFFVLTAPGLMGTGHPDFIRRELEADSSAWSISAWHVNQSRMQVGSKPDEAGWDVYEESRKGGAIIATAHEHSYCRTHLLRNMRTQEVASRGNRLEIRRGSTFAFVNGLGGAEIRPQYLSGDWWAKIYTASQGAAHGAMFGVFHVDGDPLKAEFYFKNVYGEVVDRFQVISKVSEFEPRPPVPPPPPPPRSLEPRVLVLDPRQLGILPGSPIRVEDYLGRSIFRIDHLRERVTIPVRQPGLLLLSANGGRVRRKIIIIP